MILKKPYAFLIKNFKIIHLILLGLMIFAIYFLIGIGNFFSNYSSTIIYAENISSEYIPFISIIALILIISISVIMYILMYKKRKPSLYYLLTFIYFIIIFISFLVAYGLINTLYDISLTQKASRAYMDIYRIISIPSIYFIAIAFIRGIGFDIKKFNFSKDLQELEISSEDNAEFEFVLGTDTYKIKRKTHRIFRELGYYIKENKFWLTIIGGTLGAILLVYLCINLLFINHTYHMGSTIRNNKYNLTLNKAFITSLDSQQKPINIESKYLITDVTITTKTNVKINPDYIYLSYSDNQSVASNISLKNTFSDLGLTYNGDQLSPGTYNFIFIYELPLNQNDFSYKLNVFDNVEYKNGTTNYNYKEFKFRANNLDNNSITKKPFELNKAITLGKDIYGSTSLIIFKNEIKSKYEYQYDNCINENCTKLTDVILPNNIGSSDLLIVEYELFKDEKAGFNNSLNGNTNQELFRKIIRLSYDDKIIYPLVREVSSIPNKMFIDIPDNIINKDSLSLEIITRENNYYLELNK